MAFFRNDYYMYIRGTQVVDGSCKVMQKIMIDNSAAKFGERYSIQEKNTKRKGVRNRMGSEWRESNIGNCI